MCTVQAAFKTGRRVYLTSRVSGKSLRIVEKEVNGLGGKGKKGEDILSNSHLPLTIYTHTLYISLSLIHMHFTYHRSISLNVHIQTLFFTASFFVHVRRDDVVALQNVKDPKSWLRIRDSKLEGNVSSLDSEHNYDVGGVIVCMAVCMDGGLCALFRVKVGVSASLEWRKTVRKHHKI